MPDDKFWQTIGAILSGMPPALAGAVLIALAAAVLAYSWRRATAEAKKEREKSENSSSALLDQRLGEILSEIKHLGGQIGQQSTEIDNQGKVIAELGRDISYLMGVSKR